jgi:hypothetical protein
VNISSFVCVRKHCPFLAGSTQSGETDMKFTKSLTIAAALFSAAALATPAMAQETSYKPGSATG